MTICRGYVVNFPHEGCLYILGYFVAPTQEAYHLDNLDTSNYVILLWHYRLGHHQTQVHMARHCKAIGYNLSQIQNASSKHQALAFK